MALSVDCGVGVVQPHHAVLQRGGPLVRLWRAIVVAQGRLENRSGEGEFQSSAKTEAFKRVW